MRVERERERKSREQEIIELTSQLYFTSQTVGVSVAYPPSEFRKPKCFPERALPVAKHTRHAVPRGGNTSLASIARVTPCALA